MFRLIFLCAFLSKALVFGGTFERKFRIIGGVAAKEGEIPFQVAYFVDNNYRCGGVIISPRIVMTAAHCIRSSDKKSKIIAGSLNLDNYNDGGSRRSVVGIQIHENFVDVEGDYDNDIALLFLRRDLDFNARIQAAVLPSKDEEYQNSTKIVLVSGWGIEMNGGGLSSNLKYTKVQLVPRNICIERGGDIRVNVICAGSKDGLNDSCDGDSGGPLFIGNKVIGLVSFGWPCGYNKPAGYTDIPKVREWIRQHAGV